MISKAIYSSTPHWTIYRACPLGFNLRRGHHYLAKTTTRHTLITNLYDLFSAVLKSSNRKRHVANIHCFCSKLNTSTHALLNDRTASYRTSLQNPARRCPIKHINKKKSIFIQSSQSIITPSTASPAMVVPAQQAYSASPSASNTSTTPPTPSQTTPY